MALQISQWLLAYFLIREIEVHSLKITSRIAEVCSFILKDMELTLSTTTLTFSMYLSLRKLQKCPLYLICAQNFVFIVSDFCDMF